MMMVNRFCFIIFFMLSSSVLAQEAAEPKPAQESDAAGNFKNMAVIRALNKSASRTSILELKLGEKVKFGSLTLIAHKCWQAALDQRPESKVLLEVSEEKIVGSTPESKRIFYGWMFFSSPSISSMEHAIYDVNVLSCRD